MSPFTIEGFARDCEQAMDAAADRHAALHAQLRRLLDEHSAEELVAVLEAALPAGADIGEMVVHRSPALTLLFARVPPRFQTGIHDHTVCACIGQLVGRERNLFFRRDGAGGLAPVAETVAAAGEIVDMPAEAIHCIENPDAAGSCALHAYAGDFQDVMPARRLWSSVGHVEQPFSFDALLRESAAAMRRDGNTVGLAALVEAIPKARAFVEE